MKKLTITQKLAIALIALISFTSCSSNDSNSDKANNKLGKIELVIPTELEGNKEVVNYIKGVSEVADSYALLVDEILEEYGEYIGTNSEDLTMMEQIKLTKATAEVAIKSTEIMGKWAEYQNKRNSLDQQLTDAEIQALENVWLQFEKRFEQISKKHEETLAKNNS